MSKQHRARFIALADLLARHRPDVSPNAISAGRVLVDGRFITNPASKVRSDASIRVLQPKRLRGDIKLSHALDALDVFVAGRVAVDVGASSGGFTTALLNHGAARVYAVDAGVGQLVGALRLDRRVVNLERHNLGSLDRRVVPDEVDVLTLDLSYLSIADAVPQLERLKFSCDADLVALVKPTFELSRPALAASIDDVRDALRRVTAAVQRGPWHVLGSCAAPRTGPHGAREVFIHAKRSASACPPVG